MRSDYTNCAQGCPLELALDVFAGKWKGVIVYSLLDGSKRFNELLRLKPALSQRILTKQLRELEAAGVVNRKVYAEVPPKVEYSLTELGRMFEPALQSMQQWGMEYLFRMVEQAENEV